MFNVMTTKICIISQRRQSGAPARCARRLAQGAPRCTRHAASTQTTVFATHNWMPSSTRLNSYIQQQGRQNDMACITLTCCVAAFFTGRYKRQTSEGHAAASAQLRPQGACAEWGGGGGGGGGAQPGRCCWPWQGVPRCPVPLSCCRAHHSTPAACHYYWVTDSRMCVCDSLASDSATWQVQLLSST